MKKTILTAVCLGMILSLTGCVTVNINVKQTDYDDDWYDWSEDIDWDDDWLDALDEEELFDLKEPADDGWKGAYLWEIEELRATAPDGVDENYPEDYLIYDIDKDGTPEMLVKFGTCEANYNGMLYTYDDGEVVPGDTLFMGHMALYSVPDENGIVFMTGHMGMEYMEKATLTNGSLEFEEMFDSGDEILDYESYVYPPELIQGSYYLPICSIDDDRYITQYEEITDLLEKDAEKSTEELLDDIEEIFPHFLY